jgi:hypothetical protein
VQILCRENKGDLNKWRQVPWIKRHNKTNVAAFSQLTYKFNPIQFQSNPQQDSFLERTG